MRGGEGRGGRRRREGRRIGWTREGSGGSRSEYLLTTYAKNQKDRGSVLPRVSSRGVDLPHRAHAGQEEEEDAGRAEGELGEDEGDLEVEAIAAEDKLVGVGDGYGGCGVGYADGDSEEVRGPRHILPPRHHPRRVGRGRLRKTSPRGKEGKEENG
eukprot:752192-Hanusia_phi.AAC.1